MDNSSNEYHFISKWRVQATVEEVSDVLGDATGLARWWPSVYLKVDEIEPGGADGIGKKVRLHTKGWLPYTLKWAFRVTESRRPHGFSLEAEGDFVGRGVWTFEQQGSDVDITYDWRIRADKPILKYLSFLLKPVFSLNHEWAMNQGEKSLKRELIRRRSA